MHREEAAELHNLLFTFMGQFHEKFLHQFRKKNVVGYELKKNHVKIISMLYQHSDLTSTDIAKMMDIEKGSVTTLIDQLAEFGLVIRCDTPHDRRKSLVLLTDIGKAEVENIMESDIQSINEIFRDVDSNDRKQFVDSLRYAVEFMSKL